MRIVRTSVFASDFLKTCPSGQVHSVYRRTINLLLDGQLLALQADGSPLSPISLLTDAAAPELAEPGIRPGDPVWVTGDMLLIGSTPAGVHSSSDPDDTVRISFASASCTDLSLAQAGSLSPSGLPEADLILLRNTLRQVLSSGSSDGFAGILQDSPEISGDLIRLAVSSRLSEASRAAKAGDAGKTASILCSLIGVGTGLTPSGDDYLCGVLAGLRLAGIHTAAPVPGSVRTDLSAEQLSPGLFSALQSTIPGFLDRTGEISRAFLLCALEGQFSEAVVSLAAQPAPENVRVMFDAIGHSSGRDTLCGIWFALTGSASLDPV